MKIFVHVSKISLFFVINKKKQNLACFNSVKKQYPQLVVNFNLSYLNSMERRCGDYSQWVKATSKYAFKSRLVSQILSYFVYNVNKSNCYFSIEERSIRRSRSDCDKSIWRGCKQKLANDFDYMKVDLKWNHHLFSMSFWLVYFFLLFVI